MSGPKVVLDANVLYGNLSRDVLISLFAEGFYEAKWTEEITDEWVRHLLANQPNVTPEKNRRTVFLMHQILPRPLVENYRHTSSRSIFPTGTTAMSLQQQSPVVRARS